MKFKQNEDMDYIVIDEKSMAVFDPDTGDTHFFEGTGSEILQDVLLGMDVEKELPAILKEKYNDPEAALNEDVKSFVDKLIAIKVVVPT